jgi:DUF917 family protein
MRTLILEDVEAAVTGGSVLAGGGGGWAFHGREIGELAVRYGSPQLATIDEIDPDGIVVTVSAIGSPAAPGWKMRPCDYVRALELLTQNTGKPIAAVMPSQNGAGTSTNGWLQAAITGLPVLDAAGNGRAHPTGKMGMMGLAADPSYQTIQTGVGGDAARGLYTEIVTFGSVVTTADMLRAAAVKAGGFVANARLPVSTGFVRTNAAPRAVSFAIALGIAMLEARPAGASAVIDAMSSALSGRVLVEGIITARTVETTGGFDLGTLVVTADGRTFEISLCNEYMTVESSGERLATFPDLINTIDSATGFPLSAAQTEIGQSVVLLTAPMSAIPLGAGMRDPSVYPEVEKMIGKSLASYALAS